MGRALLLLPRRRGGAAVEFALVLPVFLLLLLGFLDFGWAFYQHGIVTRALRDGCRAGAVVPATGDPIGTATSAISAALVAERFACPAAGACVPVVVVDDTLGHDVLSCTLTVPLPGLTGFVAAADPLQLKASTRAHIESWVSP